MVRYWLVKSEPGTFSFQDLLDAPKQRTRWEGIRNYTARNFMRDDMRLGDGVLFYHSSCPEPGIAGIAKVASRPYPDDSQFDRKSPYYDKDSKRDAPRWFNVDVRALRKTRLVSLDEIRKEKALAKMVTLRPGNRLSITPVTEAEWKHIQKLL